MKWAPDVVARCEHVTLYASRSDGALIISKKYNFEQRVGDAFPPICIPGIETIDVSAVDVNLHLGHSYYGSNLNLLSDLYFVLKEHRTADKRGYLTRQSQGLSGGEYWQFHDQAPYIRCSWRFGETATR
jgi:esterase/lipase superfamily enzyme